MGVVYFFHVVILYINITLIHHLSRSCGQSGDREQQRVLDFSDQSNSASCGEATPTSETVLLHVNELSLNEGKSLLNCFHFVAEAATGFIVNDSLHLRTISPMQVLGIQSDCIFFLST